MSRICALGLVTWVFAVAPVLCLGGYIAVPSICQNSQPDPSCPNTDGSHDDPCRAQITKERVAERENTPTHVQVPSLTCLALLDDSPAVGLSRSLQDRTTLALSLTADPFASRGLPLLL